jgi:hypothetical protein
MNKINGVAIFQRDLRTCPLYSGRTRTLFRQESATGPVGLSGHSANLREFAVPQAVDP